MGLMQTWSARVPGLERHCRGSLIPGSARSNLCHADVPKYQYRRLHCLTGYGANVTVAGIHGPTTADTTASNSVSRNRSLFSSTDGLRRRQELIERNTLDSGIMGYPIAELRGWGDALDSE